LHLHGHLGAGGGVIAQPHGGEVAPAEFARHCVAPIIHLTDAHRVVAALAVPLRALKVAIRVVAAVAAAVRLRVVVASRATSGTAAMLTRRRVPTAVAAVASAAAALACRW
jgi:hypothetical protein